MIAHHSSRFLKRNFPNFRKNECWTQPSSRRTGERSAAFTPLHRANDLGLATFRASWQWPTMKRRKRRAPAALPHSARFAHVSAGRLLQGPWTEPCSVVFSPFGKMVWLGAGRNGEFILLHASITRNLVLEAIAATLVRVAGTDAFDRPRWTTVPSRLSARLCWPPAEMATALVTVAGTFVCPELFAPQPHCHRFARPGAPDQMRAFSVTPMQPHTQRRSDYE